MAIVGECWIWPRSKNLQGYGHLSRKGRFIQAHRFVYEAICGPIPKGLTLDHLCRNHACVNPWHLEAVTMKENLLRGFSPSAIAARRVCCPQGHPYTKENTKIEMSNGKFRCRICRTCKNARQNEYYWKKKEARNEQISA